MKNFEKYKTVNERMIAFDEFCKTHKEWFHAPSCAFEWLDLEAEEEKPMPCPFCEDDCHLQGYATRCVACNHCGYESRPFHWKDNPAEAEVKAVAAHNRVCKAVAAYKENN